MNTSTRQSMVISAARGMLPWLKARISLRRPRQRPNRQAAPRAARHKPSIRHCRARSHRAGADGFANGHFVVPRFGAGEQEISDVHAGNQQNEADGCEHDKHGRLHVADYFVMVRIGRPACETSYRKNAYSELLCASCSAMMALEFFSRTLNAHARFEPSDNILEMAARGRPDLPG